MNKRFWARVNVGWVKLVLAPSKSHQHMEGGPTEEGYSYEWTTWAWDGALLTRDFYSRSQDCDGPLERWEEQVMVDWQYAMDWGSGTLKKRPDGMMVPVWEQMNSRQRDHYAEAMGY